MAKLYNLSDKDIKGCIKFSIHANKDIDDALCFVNLDDSQNVKLTAKRIVSIINYYNVTKVFLDSYPLKFKKALETYLNIYKINYQYV